MSVVAFPLSLMLGYAQPAAAASDLQLDGYTGHEASFQPGPGVPTSVGAVRGAMIESAPPLPAAPRMYSEKYWSAFADVDLNTLRDYARSDPEARFAEAMRLLAMGRYESAERDLLAASQQVTDISVAVASQVMLASTLRYQHRWSELRDLSLTSRLSALDRAITNDLERWGKAFAGAPNEHTSYPDKPVVLPLRMTAVGTPTIHVRINGKEYEFWLDTGSSMTVISSAVAADAKIAEFSPDVLTVKTFAGSAPVKAAIANKIEIGSIVITDSPVVIIDASLMYLRSSAEGVASRGMVVDGIIGWDTIRQFDLMMNYGAGKIILREPKARDFLDGREQSLYWLGRPLVEVSTKSGDKFHLTLDTGAQASFLNATVLEKIGVGARSAGARVYGIARTGRETSRVVPLLALNIAGKHVALENVLVYGPVTSGLINCDGILGSDVAAFGTIHIDATNGVFSVGLSGMSEDAAE
ncbi:MAG TPA: aspartyl protease family protein [Gemmatimonadaceae bacterium]|nr:aspartyl protease family protein [Gemmatimonadaceae bacterium]